MGPGPRAWPSQETMQTGLLSVVRCDVSRSHPRKEERRELLLWGLAISCWMSCSLLGVVVVPSQDGSKTENGVDASAVLLSDGVQKSSKRIPSDSSVYTAELTALNLALKSIRV